MEKQLQKKRWVNPELLVIVRSRLAEAVLAGCKVNNPSNKPKGEFSTYYGCMKDITGGCATPCGDITNS